MEVIRAALAVTDAGPIGPVAVHIDDGRILAIEPTDPPVPDWMLVPGFVDLQVNGIGAVDVATADGDEWDLLDGELLAHGVTTWCPTLVTAALEDYAEPLGRIAEAAARPGTGRPTIAGAHLEGPFLGGAPGAHRTDLIQSIDLDWLDAVPETVRIVTLAPEQPLAVAAIRGLFHRGVLVALGHSTASYAEAVAAIDAGARLVTHCFNGMGPFHHREPGLVGAALVDSRVVVSLIADLVHVHPAAITLAWKAKGPLHVVLVTDAVAHRAGTIGPVDVADAEGAPRLADGTLAGTTLTMDGAIANAVAGCGIPLVAAVAAAATNPARLLNLDDRGVLAEGRRADIVALGQSLAVKATWVGGILGFDAGQ